MSDIFGEAKKPKLLTKDDVPKIKHMCIMLYGYDWWSNAGLKEVFEQLPLIQKEYYDGKYMDEVTKAMAKSLGVKLKK